ncbi:ABC transporter permease [Henriciella aquimarina]|uniref:ABC transporter permease n=1 Tax=Henriciella aquimarina TaxID=545261 RepID=UPI000A066770|nr:ABC transporter permease [Henriciella aquimarina]
MIARAFFATFKAILSDRPAFLLLGVSFVLYSFFYPSAYTGQVAVRLPLVVVDLDNSASSRSLAVKIGATQQARVVARAPSLNEAQILLEDERATAIVLIPSGFGDEIRAGGQGVVSLYGNGAYLLRSGAALSGVATSLGALAVESAKDQARTLGAPAANPLKVIERPLFNTREGYGSTVVPGVVFLIVHQTLLMGLALLAATLREAQGRTKFPLRTFLGIALAFFVLGVAEVFYFSGFVFWLQDYPRGAGRLGDLLLSGGLFVSATIAGALALGSFFRTRERPVQIWIITSLPIYFLSGLSWPIEAMPHWLAVFRRLFPTSSGIQVMIGLNQMGAPLSNLWPDLANLFGLTAAYGVIAVCRLVDFSGGAGLSSLTKGRIALSQKALSGADER